MKTLGLIGGTSWISTIEYYPLINQQINEKLCGINLAKNILYSLNLHEVKPPSDPKGWGHIAHGLSNIARLLEDAGAECLVICANTPHIVADIIKQNIEIPLLHIAEVTAVEVRKSKIKKIGLLGTKITMEEN